MGMGMQCQAEEERRTALMITRSKLQVMHIRILVVDQGKIVEDGTFEQLMGMKAGMGSHSTL